MTTTSITHRVSAFFGTFLACSAIAFAQHTDLQTGKEPANALVQEVREATKQYLDVNNAVAAGYAPFLGCVSGSDHGAMGVHYVNGKLLNGTVDVRNPQALIYEPLANGQMRLVGVEYIAFASIWLQNNSGPPVLDGQVFLFVDSPNRFNIPAFFELHVWAWRDNAKGSFVDWNDHVSCAHG